MADQYYFKGVTLLITHYNRSSSLERLLAAFNRLNCRFEDIVISDDGSKPEHVEKISELLSDYSFRLIAAPHNKGLGNNINKGQDAVSTPYTLYIQEDFVPNDHFPDKLLEAVHYMEEREDLDMVRFYAYFRHPYLAPFKGNFSEMKFKIWYPGYKKFYIYSDHPHLRRSNFLEKFGRYKEGVKPDKAEYRMMMSFLKYGGKSLFFEHHKGLLDQVNSTEEPSTIKRRFWSESPNPLVTVVRHTFRYLKFNFNYLRKLENDS
jgi:glycosyltransferase involved in cell wall biosynthesis